MLVELLLHSTEHWIKDRRLLLDVALSRSRGKKSLSVRIRSSRCSNAVSRVSFSIGRELLPERRELLLPLVVAFIMQRLVLDVALSSGRGAEQVVRRGSQHELDQHWQGHCIRSRLGGQDVDVNHGV